MTAKCYLCMSAQTQCLIHDPWDKICCNCIQASQLDSGEWVRKSHVEVCPDTGREQCFTKLLSLSFFVNHIQFLSVNVHKHRLNRIIGLKWNWMCQSGTCCFLSITFNVLPTRKLHNGLILPQNFVFRFASITTLRCLLVRTWKWPPHI